MDRHDFFLFQDAFEGMAVLKLFKTWVITFEDVKDVLEGHFFEDLLPKLMITVRIAKLPFFLLHPALQVLAWDFHQSGIFADALDDHPIHPAMLLYQFNVFVHCRETLAQARMGSNWFDYQGEAGKDGIMDIDRILNILARQQVDCILIGGVNFLLHHAAELTFDMDIWVNDTDENLARLNAALREMKAEWGQTEKEWAPVPNTHHWLKTQNLFCLTTGLGAVDIFRVVKGLEGKYAECVAEARRAKTAGGAPYVGLSDRHMLISQEALDFHEKKSKITERIETLKKAISRPSNL